MGGAWCYGVGGCTTVASGTHVVRKPDAPPHPMQLAPPGMTSKCSVATVFQPPGLRHAPLPSPWIHPTLNQAYSPATKCCSVGGCSAGLTHQMRKPHPAPRKLRPVPPAEAHREIATVFYAPELRHARRPTPWIHPQHGVAYMADSVVCLQEPKRHPQTPTEPVPLCAIAFCCPGG
jgi:hypothetical protein